MDFVKGMDISTLIEEEQHGAKYYDNGVEEDCLVILKRYGTNSVRIRLWNNPYSPDGKPYGAGTNDLEKVIALSKRAKEHGMSVLLDFHYSDFWADPGKQFPPKKWQGKSAEELTKLVYEYTTEVLSKLVSLGLAPQMVQVGNEITNGCMWPLCNRHYGRPEGAPDTYFNTNLRDALNAGIKAVREICPEAIVMLHLDNGGNNQLYRDWFDGYFACGGADFDVMGLSYYPFWHGNLAALEYNLKDCGQRYKKPMYLAEVSTGFTMDDYASYEGLGPDERKGYATREELTKNLDYPMSKEGQKAFMEHVTRLLKSLPDNLGRGYYYWEPAWIPVPGVGWATWEALEYTGEKGPCGNEWANQALFDYDGNALPALKI
ncbi:MAG: glycosyl hydrolase 53 family protein [Lachnospiraceae bacterium]|nr:glycosyl hydrolase 53 family protein [Lachnospiraceae bacterium]